MVGHKPRFELCGGWLTLRPTDQWTQSFPLHWFSDAEPRQPGNWDAASDRDCLRAAIEAAKQGADVNMEAFRQALEEADRQRGRTRDLGSYSLFVGDALEKVLRIDDQLRFSRGFSGEFTYSVKRSSETVFSAGAVAGSDEGGPFGIWQSPEAYPQWDEKLTNARPSSFELVQEQMRQLQEFADAHKVYVSVRINKQSFRLVDEQGVRVDRYYVFLARTNPIMVPLGSSEHAVHAAGDIDALRKALVAGSSTWCRFRGRRLDAIELIADAARQLTVPKTRLL